VVQIGTALAVVEVEPWVLPVGAGTEMGREPTAGADVATAGEAGRWGHDGTPFGTSGEHYRTELPQPSSSLLPCGCRLHHPS
jgi:hypothetical protein